MAFGGPDREQRLVNLYTTDVITQIQILVLNRQEQIEELLKDCIMLRLLQQQHSKKFRIIGTFFK